MQGIRIFARIANVIAQEFCINLKQSFTRFDSGSFHGLNGVHLRRGRGGGGGGKAELS